MKMLIISIIVFLLMIIPVKAVNLDINVKPNEVKIGDDVRIVCSYDDNTTHPTPWAYIERTSWNKTLTKFNNTYFETTYTPPLLGVYEIFCSDGAINSPKTSFKVSSLDMIITDYPADIYVDEEIILHAKVIEKSDSDQVITSNVNFEVFLASKSVPIDIDRTYPYGEEWTITTEKIPLSSFDPGSYTLTLVANYKDNSISKTENIEVKTPVEFELISTDKTWVQPNDNITFTFKALYVGSTFEFRKEYLRIWINSEDVDILEIRQDGYYSYVKIYVPNLSPGTYDLNIRFNYMDFVKEIEEKIDYVIFISGTVKDSNNKPVYVQLNFRNNEVQKTFITDSGGSYSGYLPPGIYNLELTFPNSKLILNEILISEFDNPIRFDHPTTDTNIPGIGVGALFVYEIALTYSNAYLEMRYDDSKIMDETQMGVYKCKNWNFGRKECNTDWEKVNAEIDTLRNLVKVNTTELSTFVIGYKKNLYLDFNMDKDEYFLREIIRVNGIVEDDDKKPVPDATITVTIPNTGISTSAKTNSGGVFSIEFQGPDKEGTFEIFLKAEKSPFTSTDSSKFVKVLRSERLSLVIPDSIKIRQGENVSLPFEIVNTGQTDFSNLKLSLTGIPTEYFSLSKSEISQLKTGEEKKLSIYFTIPEDASKTSYTGSLEVMYDDDSMEKDLILTILSGEKNETIVTEKNFWFPRIGLPTAQVVLPGLTIDILIIVVVAISSFSIAVFLKMKKFPRLVRKVEIKPQIKPEKRFERENIKNILLDIKREINRHPVKESMIVKKVKRKTRKR